MNATPTAKALKTRSKSAIAVHTATRTIEKLKTIQSHIREVAEDPNVGTHNERGHQGFLLSMNTLSKLFVINKHPTQRNKLKNRK